MSSRAFKGSKRAYNGKYYLPQDLPDEPPKEDKWGKIFKKQMEDAENDVWEHGDYMPSDDGNGCRGEDDMYLNKDIVISEDGDSVENNSGDTAVDNRSVDDETESLRAELKNELCEMNKDRKLIQKQIVKDRELINRKMDYVLKLLEKMHMNAQGSIRAAGGVPNSDPMKTPPPHTSGVASPSKVRKINLNKYRIYSLEVKIYKV